MESKLNRVQDRLESVSDGKPSVDRDHCSPPHPWIQAIDNELVCANLGIASEEDTLEDAKRKLNLLINWWMAVAVDARVNGGYVLVPEKEVRGYRQQTDPTVDFAEDVRDWTEESF